jgi:DNA-binding winged helix-turn-helix (wHTH) protein/tetratricopeptide (TPR) repeat protein
MSPEGQSSVKITLTAEPDFRLGGLDVSPSTCRARARGAEVRVEPRVMEVLITLRRAAGRTVTHEQLVASCWEGRAVSDDAITRAIAKLRRLAQTGGEAHFVIETLPKLGFRLIPASEGDGVPSTSNRSHQDSASTAGPRLGQDPAPEDALPFEKPATSAPVGVYPRPSRLGDWPPRSRFTAVGLGLLVVAIGGLITAWGFGFNATRSRAPVSDNRVAVIPFEAASPDPVLKRLSQDTREALEHFLTVSALAPRLSSPSTGDTGPEFEIAGSVERRNESYIVKSWIRDRASGGTVWSGRFARGTAELSGLDEQVGDVVAATLRCALDQRSAATTALSTQQLSLFLNACSALAQHSADALAATGLLVGGAPAVAGAHALRAIALAEYASHTDGFDQHEQAAEARAEAERAIALNPNTALAHLALGFPLSAKPNFSERERHLRRALDLDPDLTRARFLHLMLLREVGRVRDAGEIAYRLLDSNDHFARDFLPQLILLEAQLGENQIVESLWNRLSPEGAANLRWTVAMWWEDPNRVSPQSWQLGSQSLSPNVISCFREYLHKLTVHGEAVRGLPSACEGGSLDWRVRMLSREGDLDGAYELLKQDPPASRTTMFLFYPETKALRSDPRFLPLAERLGLLSYWRETHQWPDLCSEGTVVWCGR